MEWRCVLYIVQIERYVNTSTLQLLVTAVCFHLFFNIYISNIFTFIISIKRSPWVNHVDLSGMWSLYQLCTADSSGLWGVVWVWLKELHLEDSLLMVGDHLKSHIKFFVSTGSCVLTKLWTKNTPMISLISFKSVQVPLVCSAYLMALRLRLEMNLCGWTIMSGHLKNLLEAGIIHHSSSCT